MKQLIPFLTLLGLASAVVAQTSRGTVTDSSGAVLPAAQATLTHSATGVARSTATNDAGIYRFDAVDLDVYDLNVTTTGFRDLLSKSFSVEPNRRP